MSMKLKHSTTLEKAKINIVYTKINIVSLLGIDSAYKIQAKFLLAGVKTSGSGPILSYFSLLYNSIMRTAR